MKHFFYRMLVFICAADMWKISAAQNDYLYIPDALTIKTKATSGDLSKADKKTEIAQSLGIPALDRKLSALGATEIKKRFPSNRSDDVFRLGCIYRVSFAQNSPLDEIIVTLNRDPNIEYAERIPVNYKCAIPDDPMYTDQQYLPQIAADLAWNIHKGDLGPQIVVAIVDDAVDWKHPDLVENVWQNLGEDADGDGKVIEFTGSQWRFDPGDVNGRDDDRNGYVDDFVGWDFINSNFRQDNDPSPEMSGMVHGTHVAGLAAGVTDNQIGIAGVAWNVKYIACKHDADGEDPFDSDLYKGVKYAADQGADIINMSWGTSAFSQASQDVINDAWSKGAILVAAAGNDNINSPHYPSDYSHVISVASVAVNDSKASYSNYGLGVDISAPGGEYAVDNAILSTVPGGYDRLQGTSMAAPITSGLLALMKSYYTGRPREIILKQLFNTADDIDAQNSGKYHEKLGYGRINAFRALSEPEDSMPRVLRLKVDQLPPHDANGNQAFEKGETAYLGFRISNYAPFISDKNTRLILSSQDQDIEILNDTYTIDIPADSSTNLTDIFKIRVNAQASSHMALLTLKIESDQYIIGGNTRDIKLLIGAGGILVWEPVNESRNASGADIDRFLRNHGFESIYIHDFPQSFLGFDAVFLCFGAATDSTPQFDQSMASTIRDYLLHGGKLYFEGTPNASLMENQYATMLSLMGLDNIETGDKDYLLSRLLGQANTLTQNMEFNGTSQADQHVLKLRPKTGAHTVFKESNRGVTGIFYEGPFLQKVFTSSYALGKLDDSNLPSTRAFLMSRILESFNLLPDSFYVTDFKANYSTGNVPLSIQFTDLSFSYPAHLINRWEWDLNADGIVDAIIQSPQWVFVEPDTLEVVLTTADGNNKTSHVSEPIHIFNGYSALDFNGGTSIVTIPAENELNLTQSMTLEAWIYPRSFGETSGTGFGRIIDKDKITIFLNNSTSLYHEHSLMLGIDNPAGNFSAAGSPAGSILLNQWSHIAVSYDTVSKNVSMVINGESQPVSYFYDPVGEIADHKNASLTIGNREALDRAFDGMMDEVRLWNTIRTPEEISENMNKEPESAAGLIGCWHFDEGNGSLIQDAAGNHNGTQSMAAYVAGRPFNIVSETSARSNSGSLNLELKQNYPNPFNPSTSIQYTLPAEGHIQLTIYDILGRQIYSVSDETQQAGRHILKWNGVDAQGYPAASGVYFYELKVDKPGSKTWKQTRKMLLLR